MFDEALSLFERDSVLEDHEEVCPVVENCVARWAAFKSADKRLAFGKFRDFESNVGKFRILGHTESVSRGIFTPGDPSRPAHTTALYAAGRSGSSQFMHDLAEYPNEKKNCRGQL